MSDITITLDTPEAQAFLRHLIALCNWHRLKLTGAYNYPLELDRLPPGVNILGIDTDGTAVANPTPPINFDLTIDPDDVWTP